MFLIILSVISSWLHSASVSRNVLIQFMWWPLDGPTDLIADKLPTNSPIHPLSVCRLVSPRQCQGNQFWLQLAAACCSFPLSHVRQCDIIGNWLHALLFPSTSHSLPSQDVRLTEFHNFAKWRLGPSVLKLIDCQVNSKSATVSKLQTERESQEISTWLGCSSIPQPAPETPSTWYVGRRVYVKCKFEQLKHFACIVIKLSLGKKIVPFRAGIKTKWSCLQEEERGVQITAELINWTRNIDQIVVWFSY